MTSKCQDQDHVRTSFLLCVLAPPTKYQFQALNPVPGRRYTTVVWCRQTIIGAVATNNQPKARDRILNGATVGVVSPTGIRGELNQLYHSDKRLAHRSKQIHHECYTVHPRLYQIQRPHGYSSGTYCHSKCYFFKGCMRSDM